MNVPAVVKFHPSVFPVVAGTEYSIESELSTPPVAHSLAVDPVSEDLYVVGAGNLFDEFTRVVEYDSSGNLLGSFAGPEEEGELPSSVGATSLGVAVNGATERVYVSYFGRGSQVEVFTPPPPAPPSIVSVGARDMTSGSVDLVAAINPNLRETAYRFEYGTEDCSLVPDPCTVIPPGSGDVGSARKPVSVSRQLSGLAPSTIYHFRVFAENELGSDEAERTFTTQASGGLFALLDGRGWELVSPASKPGGGAITTQYGISAASASGDAFTFQSIGPLEASPQGSRAPEPSQSLARRGVTGWGSVQIDAPREAATPVGTGGGDFHFFSSELASAVVEPKGAPLLSVEASEPAPYLRENFVDPVMWRPLVTGKEGYANVPSGTIFGGEPLLSTNSPVEVVGASTDLRHVVLSSEVPLIAGFKQTGGLYGWSEGMLQPVSVLPSGQFSPAHLGSGNSSFGTITGAVSDNGQYVYWSSAPSLDALYVRDLVNNETVRLDTVRVGASGEGAAHPVFQGASADGTRVFFTDTQRLTTDAGPGFDLYECDLVRPNKDKCVLRDITPQIGGEAAAVQGLVPAIGDTGDTVYFIANGALNGTPGPAGETPGRGGCIITPARAKAGTFCNLYVSHIEGETWQTRFVTRLDNQDSADWGLSHLATGDTDFESGSGSLVATGSPNGRYLTFMSSRSLTGYDNADAASGAADQEIYLYDSVADTLHCVSCNPTGGEPQGTLLDGAHSVDWNQIWSGRWVAATLPDPVTVIAGVPGLYRPRVVLDDGRVFFNAADSLVVGDSNGTWDAYEYEPQGLGDCGATPEGLAVARSEGGCVGLLSSGTSSSETGILDSSVSGNDVFFLTTAQLSPRDKDSAYDVYDARVDATPETLGSTSECLGEACQPSPVAPNDLTPASISFEGTGNLVAPLGSAIKPRSLTRTQKLASALKACRKRYGHAKRRHAKRRRVACERRARKRYGVRSKRASGSGKGGR
ncbi:MAG TPA: hypothetical protein VIJ66_04890 [Solirubrobacteraceae bacterium]